jgi:nucleotide-binding universal stress UspA family protein
MLRELQPVADMERLQMISFDRILFPVDLSKQSREAAPFVIAMTARFSSKLIVLHVLGARLSYYTLPAAATPIALQRDQEERHTRQKEFESFIAELGGDFSVQPRLLEGDAAECIVSCALENNVDLVMMPTHGYGRFRRLLLGSVTSKVLHDVACPVWTGVHTDDMWPRIGQGWNRFLCAVDADIRDAPLLKWAAQFACEQHAELQVVHAVHAASPTPGTESESLCDFLFDIARKNVERLKADAGTKLDIRLRLGPVGYVVREAALEQGANLMLVGRGAIQKGFGRLHSSAYAIIREAPCPVISI